MSISQLTPNSLLEDRYEAIFRISQTLMSNRDRKDLHEVLVRELREVLEFSYLILGVYDENSREMHLKMFDEAGAPIQALKLAPEETMMWWVWQHQHPLMIPFLEQENRFPAAAARLMSLGIRSVCTLPLTTVHRRLGSVAVGSKQPDAYNGAEISFLWLVANQVALAIDDAISNEELRRSEAYLAEGQRLSQVGNWVWNLVTGEIFGSREFFRIIEFDPSTAKPTQDIFLPLVHPDDRARMEREAQEMIAEKKDRELDFRIAVPSGAVRHIHEVCHPVFNASGELVEIIGSFMDVTERKAAEEALLRAQAELERKNQRLNLLLEVTNQVISNLDLRDLLRAISGSVRRVMECDGVGVVLPDGENNQLRVYALDFPENKGCIKEEHVISMDGSPIGQAYQSGEPVLHDHRDGSGSHKCYIVAGGATKCSCFIPLLSRERPAGVLALVRLGNKGFREEEVAFLTQVARQVAIAVENACAYQQIASLKDQLAQENLYLEDEIRSELNFEEIIGESSALRRVLGQVETVAPTDSTVLIYGETGTGKELIARAIHNLSARRPNAFVKLNCAAIPTGLLESELFGHEKGAFTGAVTQRIGRFELGHHGTIFLDEIGEIPLELQPKLLRVLQEREFERLGGARTLRTDARLIAATNSDLATKVAEQQFRSDLFYRLNVFPLRVPPLRERPEDIPMLVRHFAQQFARRMNKTIESISSETMNSLARYYWPGNIRELQNVIERAVILSTGPGLKVSLVDLKPRSSNGQEASNPLAQGTLEAAERKHILAALGETNWVVGGRNGAAVRLGLNRSTLQFRMRKLGLVRPDRTPGPAMSN